MIINSNKHADILTKLDGIIGERLSKCESFQQINDFVTLIPMEELSEFGFPSATGKDDWVAYVDTDHKSRRYFIILNMKVCQKASFSNAEMEAVIMHELGHILNECEEQEYSLAQFITTREPYSKYLELKIQLKIEYARNKEFFADAYASVHGCTKELISSMKKYLNQDFSKNKDLFKLRIERLESDKNPMLSGKIKEFTQ